MVEDMANADQDRGWRRITATLPESEGEGTATWVRSKLVVCVTSLVGPVVKYF
jgi:hypothetical protein